MRFRPCIDIHKGKVKQIVGGTLTDKGAKENFSTEKSAAKFAAMYQKDNLPGGHIIMLGPGNEEQARAALQAYPGGMQIGGGINADKAYAFIEQGASHVIVTSYVFKDGRINYDNLERLKRAVGAPFLVLDLSCRQRGGTYFVVTDRWQNFTDFEITQENLEALAGHCTEFLIHGVDVEGKQQGIQDDLVEKLGRWATIPTTYAGGARSIADLERVKQLGDGCIDLTIGSALDIFGGDLPYKEVVAWHKEQSESIT